MPPLRKLIAALLGAGLMASAAPVAAETNDAPIFERVETGPVALVADEISYDTESGIVRARGSVEVYQGGRTLTADEIAYDSQAERLSATGAITLRTEDGETVYADMADLDAALRDGVIQGAKTVIANGGAKIAAVEAQRVDNRYNVLSKAVFSPCEVCAERPVPLWRIRARRIVHDQDLGEIHYEDAYFDVMGVTVGFLPYFRHPSPEVKRATGFLSPILERDRAYGEAIKVPYYFVLDEHSDVTVTPFVSVEDGALVEFEYRRLFERGYVNFDVATGVTDYGNDGKGARARFGGFGEGRYSPRDGFHLGFDMEIAADDPFLRRYDYTEDDRLTTELFARAYDGPNYATVTTAYLQSLRTGEDQETLPFVTPEVSARYVTVAAGGELGLSLDGVGLVRETGRDVGRLSLGADWSRQAITTGGLVLRGFADARADLYAIDDDPAFDGDAARFAPRAGIEARMPFIRTDEAGGLQIIEPIVQFVVAPEDIGDGDIPNEDSVLAEFDEINLFETDRQPGFDRFESGTRVTIGAKYERIFPGGLGLRATGGRIFRFDEIRDFTGGSGLGDDSSDYVGGFDVFYQDWAELRSSWRLSDNFDVERAEIGGALSYDMFSAYAAYLFIDSDPAAGSPVDREEATFGGAVELDRNWTIAADARRDLQLDRFVTAGATLSYVDECAGFDFYVRRRFTETVSDPDGTSVGFRVRLFGGDGGDRSKASGACAYGAGGSE